MSQHDLALAARIAEQDTTIADLQEKNKLCLAALEDEAREGIEFDRLETINAELLEALQKTVRELTRIVNGNINHRRSVRCRDFARAAIATARP